MQTITIFCLLLAVFLFFLLIGLSFHRVHYYEIGLQKSASTGTVNRDSVFKSGNYFIGPDGTFVTFPSLVQNKYLRDLSIWSLSSPNDAGTFLNIDVSFQFYIIPEKLGLLYNKVGTNYEKLVENLAITAIKNEAVKWSADNYLTSRRLIEKGIFGEISKVLVNESNCNVTGVQLGKVLFPELFYNRKLDAAIQNQYNIAEDYRQEARVIRGQTSQEVVYIKNNIIEVSEISIVQSTNIKETANNQATKIIQDSKTEGLLQIRKSLNITNNTEFLSLDYILQLEKSTGINYFINYDKTSFIIK